MLRSALPGERTLEVDPLVEALLASLRFTRVRGRAARRSRRPASRGQRLVVVSNWDVSLHGVLRALELEPLLDGILTSAEAGARKPAPAIFEQALAVAGVGPARRFTSVTPSTRTSPALAAPESSPCSSAGDRALPCPACGRSRAWPNWPGSRSRGARLAGPKLV